MVVFFAALAMGAEFGVEPIVKVLEDSQSMESALDSFSCKEKEIKVCTSQLILNEPVENPDTFSVDKLKKKVAQEVGKDIKDFLEGALAVQTDKELKRAIAGLTSAQAAGLIVGDATTYGGLEQLQDDIRSQCEAIVTSDTFKKEVKEAVEKVADIDRGAFGIVTEITPNFEIGVCECFTFDNLLPKEATICDVLEAGDRVPARVVKTKFEMYFK